MAGDPLAAREATNTATQLAANFGVFRRVSSDADAVPADVLVKLGPLRGATDTAFSRRALVTSAGNAVYLIPSATGVCLVDSSGSQSGCFEASEAVTTGAVQSTECSMDLPSEIVEIAGVLPDGVTSAEAVLENGSTVPIEIEGNAFIAQFPRRGARPVRIRIETASGPESLGSTVPADVATEQCVGADGAVSGNTSASSH